MRKHLFLSLYALLCVASGLRAGEIRVSPTGSDTNPGTKEAPLRTVAQALHQAREWRRLSDPAVQGGIHIILQGGTYPQETVLFLRPEDSGTPDAPTMIEAGDGEEAVISGGISVAGRTKVVGKPAGFPVQAQGNLWVIDPPMKAGRIVYTRQLWVNGRKAVRAAQFEPGVMERMTAFDAQKKEIRIPVPAFSGLQEARHMEMMVHQRWAVAMLRVKHMRVQGKEAVVTFHEPESGLEFAHPWPQPVIGGEKGNSSYYLCNAPAFLDQPGEWYQEYPSGKIYYWPRKGEDMPKADIILPALEQLVLADGTLDRPVSHITFKNIRFEYAGCLRPSLQGHVTLQGGMYLIDAYKLAVPGLPEKAELENQAWIARPEAAVTVRGARSVSFERCTFRRLASTALDYERAVTESAVENCLFTDVGGTAILLGAFPDGGFETHVPYLPGDPREYCSHIRIADNLITDVTNEDWGCVGIGAGYVSDVTIEHNEVSHVNYSGICVGWGWTKLDSGMKNNHIRANYVHHFARQLYDAGGLYTLSSQPGSTMTDNRVEDLIRAPYATNDRAFYIYFDEATSHYLVENNWCPEPRFDSNNPGPGNVWKNNGPGVSETVKRAAGVRP